MDFSAAGGGGGGGGIRSEPARWLEIAGKLLAARDLVGCKRLAERAVEADPLLPGADELLAVADVFLASQHLILSGRPDPVVVLQLQSDPDPAAVKRSFRRLSELLSSPRNPYPAAGSALRFVQEAFADLSDYLKSASAAPPPAPAPAPATAPAAVSADASAALDAFWTTCPYCCHVYQFERELVGRALRCQSAGCRRAFVATEIPNAPPIVPGTDMYYCAWGFFPMDFPKAADLSNNWKPFSPMFPSNSSSLQPASVETNNVDVQNVENNGGPINANTTPASAHLAKKSEVSGSVVRPSRGMVKKTTARKKVGAVVKKHTSGGVESSNIGPSMLGSDSWNGNVESAQTVGTKGININEVAKATDGSTILNFGGDGDIGFDLDVDGTDAILGNLHNLPFLREDDNNKRMF